MRATVTLDEALLSRARELTGIERKSALLRAALEALIASEAGKRLAVVPKRPARRIDAEWLGEV